MTRAPLGAGELIQSGTVGTSSLGPGRAELSFTVDPGWAVAGDLAVGDRIAVYATDDDGRTEVVLADVHVLRIAGPDRDGFGSDGAQTITVATDDEERLGAVVSATRAGDLTVVRVTGAAGTDEAEP